MSDWRWFRCYNEVVTDRKFRQIAHKLKRTAPEAVGVWIAVLAAANVSEPRGSLNGFGPRDLAETLLMPQERARAYWSAFFDEGLIQLDGVRQWKHRQFDSDSSTERVRKLRLVERELG